MSHDGPEPDAAMDPWCTVALGGGDHVLFGFALRHPATGGLGWTRSTPVIEMDEAAGRATTASGRRYVLGRRLKAASLPDEGMEAWLAYDLLVGPDALDASAVPRVSVCPPWDVMWVVACKVSRHLGLQAPGRAPSEVADFLTRHLPAYARSRARQTVRR